LFFQTYTYHLMSSRPVELFAPINWFDKLFMPVFPSVVVWVAVIVFLIFVNLRLLKYPESKWERYVLAVGVMWVNCIRWKYEFFSHVGHIMVLYHLLGAFLPQKKEVKELELLDYAKAVKWFFAGLLVGYTMSGLWKIIGFVYKVTLKSGEMTWFHPDAMLVNSVVGYRDWDQDLSGLASLYSIHWPWQILFVMMLCLQLFSVLGAVRHQLLPYIALGNILFHLANVFFIRIEFYVTPMVLLTAFFPYHLIFKSIKEPSRNFENGEYTRVYENGDCDRFSGFYAFREYKYDQNPLVWGLLYFPFVSLLAKPFFKLRNN